MKSKLAKQVAPVPKSPPWLGFSPATSKDIEELEDRLGVLLPPSYKAFLQTSNGWSRTTAFIGRIRPTQEVNWFQIENEQWVEAYSQVGLTSADKEYYDYGVDGASDLRGEHMASLLQISDVEDGVYLLNPDAVMPNGEWEAWFFANWIPGAHRYPSFAHLMLREYQSFTELEKIKKPGYRLLKLETPPATVPRIKAERNLKRTAISPLLEDLIEQMRSTDKKTRAKAVRTFFGKLKGRNLAKRLPDLVKVLSELFYASRDADVRSACIQGITEMAEKGTSPAPLFDALSDPDPGVVLSGIFALSDFPDARAVDPLCKFIESGINALINENAMSRLGQMRDERAVPTLTKVLLDTKNKFDQNFGTAGIALGGCGPRGFEALASALSHGDARVRLAAVVGLDVSGERRATALLDRMKRDPDPKVRQRAAIRMGPMFQRLLGR